MSEMKAFRKLLTEIDGVTDEAREVLLTQLDKDVEVFDFMWEDRANWLNEVRRKNKQLTAQVSDLSGPTVRCDTCAGVFPRYFVEDVEMHGIFSDGRSFGPPEVFGAAPGRPRVVRSCFTCSMGYPHPNPSEDEDAYVERLKEWKREQRETP